MSQLISSERCKKCGEEYTLMKYKWCKPCQINFFKKNFTEWTSGNEQIDDFIQERQLEFNLYYDELFEWISYNQFDNVKEIGKSDLITVYSAVWKNGPLYYDYKDKKEWIRKPGKKVALKYFLQDI